MTGTFSDHCKADKINRLGRWYKPWFYTVIKVFLYKKVAMFKIFVKSQHVRKFLDTGASVEFVPTMDFFFRHNKPFFWLTHVWVPFGNNPIFR